MNDLEQRAGAARANPEIASTGRSDAGPLPRNPEVKPQGMKTQRTRPMAGRTQYDAGLCAECGRNVWQYTDDPPRPTVHRWCAEKADEGRMYPRWPDWVKRTNDGGDPALSATEGADDA